MSLYACQNPGRGRAKPRREVVYCPSTTTHKLSRASLGCGRGCRGRFLCLTLPLTAPSCCPTSRSLQVLHRVRGWEPGSSPNMLPSDSACVRINIARVPNSSLQNASVLKDPFPRVISRGRRAEARWRCSSQLRNKSCEHSEPAIMSAAQPLKFFAAHPVFRLKEQRPARGTIRFAENFQTHPSAVAPKRLWWRDLQHDRCNKQRRSTTPPTLRSRVRAKRAAFALSFLLFSNVWKSLYLCACLSALPPRGSAVDRLQINEAPHCAVSQASMKPSVIHTQMTCRLNCPFPFFDPCTAMTGPPLLTHRKDLDARAEGEKVFVAHSLLAQRDRGCRSLRDPFVARTMTWLQPRRMTTKKLWFDGETGTRFVTSISTCWAAGSGRCALADMSSNISNTAGSGLLSKCKRNLKISRTVATRMSNTTDLFSSTPWARRPIVGNSL